MSGVICDVKNIESLIPLREGSTIIAKNVKRLTTPGENLGSLMLSSDLTVKSAEGTNEIHAAVKTVPPNDFLQAFFETQVSFRNEIAFYKTIIPLLQNFQREHGIDDVIDIFPEYYGSRINLDHDDSGTVDSDAALVLENLKTKNYCNLNRFVGFDFETAAMVMVDLARFHALPIAVKIQRPELFDKQIKPFFRPWKVTEEAHSAVEKLVAKVVGSIDEIRILQERVVNGFRKAYKSPFEPRHPFATITHNDLWLNNVIINMENGLPVKSKIVDFQVFDYGSPAKDVLFLLFSSVQVGVIAEHYDDLIRLYHGSFIKTLQEVGCNTSEFSMNAFLKEIDYEAEHSQFSHLSFMLFPIFGEKKNAVDIDKITKENMKGREVTELQKQRMKFLVQEFAKRRWI